MGVVCKGSSVKGSPGEAREGVRRRLQGHGAPFVPWGGMRETQPSPKGGDERGLGIGLRSPSFGISAINNLGTQCFQQHFSSAILVVNSAVGRRREVRPGLKSIEPMAAV